MPEPDLFLLFVRPLNRAKIRYVVSDSVAAIFYGEPRLTHDVDFVVFLKANDIQRLIAVFPAKDFYLPPIETMLAELVRVDHGHFNLIHRDTGFKADFYMSGQDEFHEWAFRNARRMEYRGEPIVVAPPEYVIIRKLEYYREGGSEKHRRDIRSMLAVSGEQLNRPELDGWMKRRGLADEWQRVAAIERSGSGQV